MDFFDKGFNDLKTLNKIGLLKVALFCVTFFLIYSLIVFEMNKTCKVGSKNFVKCFLIHYSSFSFYIWNNLLL